MKKCVSDGCCTAASIEKKIECLCGKKPTAFLTALYPTVQELVSFVNDENRCKPEESQKTFAVLARSISRIYTRIDSGGDIIDCALKRPLVQDEGGGMYSYKAVTAKMRRLRGQCLEMTEERAEALLPKKFSECTRLFSYACGKDFENRWNLLVLYNDLIADMWGCAKVLSGDKDTGESAA